MGVKMEIETFAEIESQLMERVNKAVWCNMATVDTLGRPRSRVIHPIWDGQTAWITTRPTSFKAKHLAHNPYVSLAYVSDPIKPAYIDARAEWIEDLTLKHHVWNLCLKYPEPMGFDPKPIYKSIDDPSFGVLRLTPWRVHLG